jgi:hypothetical protein
MLHFTDQEVTHPLQCLLEQVGRYLGRKRPVRRAANTEIFAYGVPGGAKPLRAPGTGSKAKEQNYSMYSSYTPSTVNLTTVLFY